MALGVVLLCGGCACLLPESLRIDIGATMLESGAFSLSPLAGPSLHPGYPLPIPGTGYFASWGSPPGFQPLVQLGYPTPRGVGLGFRLNLPLPRFTSDPMISLHEGWLRFL